MLTVGRVQVMVPAVEPVTAHSLLPMNTLRRVWVVLKPEPWTTTLLPGTANGGLIPVIWTAAVTDWEPEALPRVEEVATIVFDPEARAARMAHVIWVLVAVLTAHSAPPTVTVKVP